MATWRTVVQTDYPVVGGPGYSTWHFRDDADGGLADALQLATDTLETAYKLLQPSLNPTVQIGTDGRWVEVDGERLVDVDGFGFTGTTATPTDSLPPQSQICVSWGTESNTRSGRGRTFLGGWAEDNNVLGVPGATMLGRCRSLGASIVAFNNTVGNGAFVIYSPTQGIARDITRSSVAPRWATLRSRAR